MTGTSRKHYAFSPDIRPVEQERQRTIADIRNGVFDDLDTRVQTPWKLLESIPDKNGFVIFGAKEDPDGHFVSREKAIEFMQLKDQEIKQKVSLAREEVLEEVRTACIHDAIEASVFRTIQSLRSPGQEQPR